VKKASVTAVTYEVICPECGEAQGSPETGSHLWTAQEVREVGRPYQEKPPARQMSCWSCKMSFSIALPKRALST
jgi:predicted RNA-binding Zn-ribbon protein involved in translation (DUF1610 family)